MRFFPKRKEESEWMDQPDCSPEALEASLKDLCWVNRYLGGASVIKRLLQKIIHQKGLRKFSILDIATGSGDIPIEMVKWGRSNGFEITIKALDKNSEIIKIAQSISKDCPEISFEVSDFFKNTYPGQSFDFCISSLFLHHLSSDLIKPFLKEIFRLCRHAVVVNDLVRGWIPYTLFKLIGPVAGLHPMTRHDGAVSILRALTISELESIVKDCHFNFYQIQSHFPYRLSLTLEKEIEHV